MSDAGRLHKRIMDRIKKIRPQINEVRLTEIGLLLNEELSRPPEPEWHRAAVSYANLQNIPAVCVVELFSVLHDAYEDRHEHDFADTFWCQKIGDLLSPGDDS